MYNGKHVPESSIAGGCLAYIGHLHNIISVWIGFPLGAYVGTFFGDEAGRRSEVCGAGAGRSPAPAPHTSLSHPHILVPGGRACSCSNKGRPRTLPPSRGRLKDNVKNPCGRALDRWLFPGRGPLGVLGLCGALDGKQNVSGGFLGSAGREQGDMTDDPGRNR